MKSLHRKRCGLRHRVMRSQDRLGKDQALPPNNRLERAGVFGEPSRGSMIRINQLRLPLAQPRGAQPHR